MSKTKLMDNKTVGMVGRFLNENAPTLLIGGAIGTLVGALYAAFKASGEVSSVKDTYDQKVKGIEAKGLSDDDKAKEIKDAKSDRNVKYILAYKWVGLLGIASISLMIGANAMNGAKIATLTTLAVANQDKLKKLAENGKKMIGEEPWKDVENKTLDDIISENFFGKDGPKAKRIDPKNGELFILYSPDFTRAILFQSMREDIENAIESAERYFKLYGERLSEDKFFEFLGFVADPAKSEGLIWNAEHPFKVHIGSRKCFGTTFRTLEYDVVPVRPDYSKDKEAGFCYKTKKQEAGGKMV